MERLGFASDGLVDIGLRAWPLVPLLLVVAVAAAWWRRWSIAATIGALASIYAGGMGIAVWRAPSVSTVHPLNGALTTIGGAAIVLAGSTCCAVGGIVGRRI